MSTQPAVLICAQCRGPLNRGRFQLTRFDPNGAHQGSVNLCSLLCLLNWTYRFSLKKGSQGINMFKDAIMKIGDMLGGRR
jgi:hypothetical protein